MNQQASYDGGKIGDADHREINPPVSIKSIIANDNSPSSGARKVSNSKL